ncbi:MAG: hypothetical protein R2991_13880 [Thermoanaerobaculia bacterium]
MLDLSTDEGSVSAIGHGAGEEDLLRRAVALHEDEEIAVVETSIGPFGDLPGRQERVERGLPPPPGALVEEPVREGRHMIDVRP